MGDSQFNVLVEDVESYLADFKAAGCETLAEWSGAKPLKVTISAKEWVDQLQRGDIVEYDLEPVRRNDKNVPGGTKVGTRGVAMRIISRVNP